ncbi:hypothetical protein, partial [Citrobacter freundii]|uniref:hypothetical protein n=1 Tax=Citrobacter freundii TaxID=546 RepID=UPI00404249DB
NDTGVPILEGLAIKGGNDTGLPILEGLAIKGGNGTGLSIFYRYRHKEPSCSKQIIQMYAVTYNTHSP